MKRIYIISILIGLLYGLSSCSDFLFEDPKTSMSTAQIFADIDNIQPYLNGIYFKYRDTRVNRKGFFLLLGTDEVQQGEYQVRTEAQQSGLDKYDGFYFPENNSIAQLWNVRWPVVTLSTMALSHLNDMEKNASETDLPSIKSYIGQASFYRACALFELVQYWGELPIPDLQGEKVVLSGRKPLQTVYEMIESDFNKAAEYLPEKASGDVRIPRTWAAKAMLAKMYMSALPESGFRDLGKAKVLLNSIITEGGFRLVNQYADLWDGTKDASSEIIYAFYFNNVWPDTNELQWYAGSRAVSGDPNCYMGGYDLGLPTKYCYEITDNGGIWEAGDLRKDESIRYNFFYNGKAPAPVAGFGEDQTSPHIKKYEDKRIDGEKSFYNSGKNVYLVRYADVLLLYAECLNEENNTAEAVNLINNTIRSRAWGGNLPAELKWNTAMSQDEFRSKIMDERMRELCFEGWRRMDLIRTGNFVEKIKTHNRWAKESGTIQQFHERFPIPHVEIKQNTNITEGDQNPGY